MAEHTKGAELVAPRRRVLLTLKLDADSWKDMADRLRCLARDIDIEGGMGTAGLSAGYSASYTYEASEDPTITHDSWAAALDVYLEALHARERIAADAPPPEQQARDTTPTPAPPEAREERSGDDERRGERRVRLGENPACPVTQNRPGECICKRFGTDRRQADRGRAARRTP